MRRGVKWWKKSQWQWTKQQNTLNRKGGERDSTTEYKCILWIEMEREWQMHWRGKKGRNTSREVKCKMQKLGTVKRGRDLQKCESLQRRQWSGCHQSALGQIFWHTFCQLGTGEALRLQIIGVTCIKADEGSKHGSCLQITEAGTGVLISSGYC